jgi:flagellar biosynthetic protein FliQ
MTLSFIPKILAMVVVIVVLGPWMLGQLESFTIELYGSIPARVGR